MKFVCTKLAALLKTGPARNCIRREKCFNSCEVLKKHKYKQEPVLLVAVIAAWSLLLKEFLNLKMNG